MGDIGVQLIFKFIQRAQVLRFLLLQLPVELQLRAEGQGRVAEIKVFVEDSSADFNIESDGKPVELIIDPVCSLAFESEQEEIGVMARPPRDPKARFFGLGKFVASILSGTLLLAMVIGVYLLSLGEGHSDGGGVGPERVSRGHDAGGHRGAGDHRQVHGRLHHGLLGGPPPRPGDGGAFGSCSAHQSLDRPPAWRIDRRRRALAVARVGVDRATVDSRG